MDWTTPLRSQQKDFIKRLKSGTTSLHQLIDTQLKGCHSELTIVKGDELEKIDKFCWEMVDSYGRTSRNNSRDIYVNNMKGKLGELVVARYLDELVTPIDLDRKPGGDGGIDFRLISEPETCIQVKARHQNIDHVKWSISQQEIRKNAVLVCIFIQEEINQRQSSYSLVLAGFIPTDLIKELINRDCIEVKGEKAFLGFADLLYGGGLRSYLEFFKFNEPLITQSKPEAHLQTNQNTFFPAISIGSWRHELSLEDLLNLELAVQMLKKTADEELSSKKERNSASLSPQEDHIGKQMIGEELNLLWNSVVENIEPYSARVMLRQQCKLVAFDQDKALVGVSSQPLLKMAVNKRKNLEAAFETVLNCKIVLVIEYVASFPE